MPPSRSAPDRPPEPAARPEGADLGDLAEAVAARVAEMLAPQLAPGPRALLTLAEAAARLNVSERTVEALVASGDIPVTRIGTGRGVRRFCPDALDAFVRRNTRSL